MATAADQQPAQSPSSPNARPSNSATPNSANGETNTTNVDKTSSGDAASNANMNAMFASAMQQFLQQQQYLSSANAWFNSQFFQKQMASPAGSAASAFVFPPPGLAAFMPNTSVASSIGDPLSADSTPTTNGSNNILSAFLAANPMKNDKQSNDEDEERQKSSSPVEKTEEEKQESSE